MRKLIRVGAAATAAAVFVVALGGVAAAKTVSDKKYVKTLCGSISSYADAYNQVADDYNSLATTDAAAFQSSAAALVDGLLAEIESSQKKMKKLSPESGGKKVTKLFDSYFTEIKSKLSDAVEAFRAADPNGVAFQADVAQLQVAFNILEVGLGDPFREIDDRDLLGAIDDEKSCDDIVTVIGG